MAYVVAQGTPGRLLLAALGPTFPVEVVGPSGSAYTEAMIDDGSTVSSVDASLLLRVGALQVSTTTISTVEPSPVVVPVDSGVTIRTLGGIDLAASIPGVLADTLSPPVQVLIGRDILDAYHFVEDGPSGSWELDGGTQPAAQGSGTFGEEVVAGVAATLLAVGAYHLWRSAR